MIDHYGEQVAIPLARKHIGWYSSGLKGSADFRAKINVTQGAENVRDAIENFYASQCLI
jgi:tRNA-dihydrouridine synthase B